MVWGDAGDGGLDFDEDFDEVGEDCAVAVSNWRAWAAVAAMVSFLCRNLSPSTSMNSWAT